MNGDDQQRLLDFAEANHLSVRSLRAIIDREHGEHNDRNTPLPGFQRLPRPPANLLRQLLEDDPEGWLLWQPSSGQLRPAHVA